MDKKKFLFVSLDGLIADIAWQVVKEGHEVKLFCEAESEREIGDGFVPKTDDWVKDVPWADVVIFDDVLGQGAKAHQLRQTGKLVYNIEDPKYRVLTPGADVNKATEIDPKSDRAWFQMGKAFERLAGLPAAADALNRAISINPRASSYYYVLATVYRRIGKMQESRAAMESFTRLERETNELEKKRREINRNAEPVSARPDGGGHD